MIFSRNRGSAGRHSGDTARTGRRGRGRAEEAVELESLDESEPPRPEFGPYDLSQAPPDGQERLDLGALRIPAIPGVEI
ncbi:MAG TPA: DUF3710 domain-containing protein, partial [Micromonosporaceae bacterium]